MIKVCVSGACGRMGRRILELVAGSSDMVVGGAFDLPENAGQKIILNAADPDNNTVVVGADAGEEIAAADVLIDFTAAEACVSNIHAAVAAGKPAVVGTTGLHPEQVKSLIGFAHEVPIVYAPNMSIGVNLLFKLTREVASILGLDYNIEIVEVHHNQKKDSPSGTAVRLAERAAEGVGLVWPDDIVFGREGLVGARPERQIGVHALRGGDVVGEHTVSFIGNGERVELVHKAHNRDNFARGALLAAKYVVKQHPGVYDMQDVLGLK
jgi:4-hydroxy-tetrahydrodipicolinate reductase